LLGSGDRATQRRVVEEGKVEENVDVLRRVVVVGADLSR